MQALLASDVEQPKPSAAEVDRAYAESGARFHTPERRVASHLLAPLPKDATPQQVETARAFVAEALKRLRAAPDPLAALAEYRKPQSQPIPVQVEDLPAAPQRGAFVQAFSDAMFSLPVPGVVPEPVRTQFGWHAIVLREIQPETHVPEAEARAQLTRELDVKAERERLEALFKKLSRGVRIQYASETRESLAKLEL